MAGEGHSVQRACRVLAVAESGYYAWRQRPPSARTVRHAWLTEAIIGIHAASRGTYGIRRVHAELALGLGIHVHHSAVLLLMRRAGLQGLPGNRTRRTRRQTPSVADLVERDFTRYARDQQWVTDITEHPTWEGKVYCAVVLDTFSRRVVGWSIDASPTAALTRTPWPWPSATATRSRAAPSSTPTTGCRVDSTGRRNTLISEVCDVATADWSLKTSDVPERARRQWRADRALRPAMRSPGRLSPVEYERRTAPVA